VTDIDLLMASRGAVTAPAGCGKTHLIADALKRHERPKPIVVLTHTNAGVAALRSRLDKARVPPRHYRLAKLDGWAMRLISTFPARSAHHPSILELASPKTDYPAIRGAASKLLGSGHIGKVLSASYDRLVVDEYQDCSVQQHEIVCLAAEWLPTCVLGDPMQAIFGFAGRLVDWETEVLTVFRPLGELTWPWRWINAGTEAFGEWLLAIWENLWLGRSIDLRMAPPEVSWVRLGGEDDHVKRLRAARTPAPDRSGTVLVTAESKNPAGHRQIASQTPGAVTVENVDLRDLVEFARAFDLTAPDAVERLVDFAGKVMTSVGTIDFLRRVDCLRRGTARSEASDAELAALEFVRAPSTVRAANLLVQIGRQGGVRPHRPAVLRACLRALHGCDPAEEGSFYDAVIRAREQNRMGGRPLARRAVGSTLLLKGLEADVSVVLNVEYMDARHLYVAMTRGSKKLVVCSHAPVLMRPRVAR
jgi:hypothetical protein